MPLETVPDPFDEATHCKLDELVNKDLEPLGDTVNHLAILLTVIQKSQKRLDQAYASVSEAIKLISANEELREMLELAWKAREYREIRKLTILHPKPIITSNSVPELLTDAMQKKLMDAMTRPYHGVAVDALHEYLEKNNRDFSDNTRGKYYAKFCSIVQSSGAGKTRTMLQLAEKGVLVLYVNLRPKEDKSGFPARDDIPASILTDHGGSEQSYHIQCYAFFATIFKLVEEDLSSRLKSHPESAVESWNNDMKLQSTKRIEFFIRLKTAYYKVMKKAEMVSSMKNLSIEDTGNTSSNSNLDGAIAETEMQDQYMRMTKLFSSAFPGVDKDTPKLVIALDEAHPLHESKGFRRATVLFRVIKTYSMWTTAHAVWVLFASTTSKVAHFASPQALFNSSRVSNDGELLFPPFSELGWDQNAPPLNKVRVFELAKARVILRYGRPLWESLKELLTLEQLLRLAVDKLDGIQPHDVLDPNRALAVLAQRFGLEVCFGHREAVRYVEAAVASYLRVCITTTENRLWSYTTYPSEPFLSCAAAYSLHKTLETTLKTLEDKVDNGMIDIGQRGELVSRLLWLLAKDLFVLRKEGKNVFFQGDSGYEEELVHCKMIPVIEFFKFVFGDGFWVLAGDDATAAFENAYVNFSHWVSMDANIKQRETAKKKLEQLGLDEWTRRHWLKTSAVQCCHNQPLIDKVLPIYFKRNNGDEDDSVCVSHIFISDKDREKADSVALNKIQRLHWSIGDKGYANPYPYIAILADLGLEEVGLDSASFASKQSDRYGHDGKCLRMRAKGLNPDTYPFLGDYPVVLHALQRLARKQRIPTSERPYAQFLRDQVRYGSSAEVRHMHWESSSATVMNF